MQEITSSECEALATQQRRGQCRIVRSRTIQNMDIGVAFSGARFIGCRFIGCRWQDQWQSVFEDCTIADSAISDITFDRCDFVRTEIVSDLGEVTFANSSFISSALLGHCYRVQLTGCVVQATELPPVGYVQTPLAIQECRGIAAVALPPGSAYIVKGGYQQPPAIYSDWGTGCLGALPELPENIASILLAMSRAL